MVEADGKAFKNFIRALCRFPAQAGAFAGGDMITLYSKDGFLYGVSLGVVLARAKVKASGDFGEPVGVDRRALEGYCSVLGKKVSITREEKIVTFRGRRKLVAPAGEPMKDTGSGKLPSKILDFDKELAERMAYLSNISFGDTSRPELCCVYLQDGKATACDQRMIAQLRMPEAEAGLAVPLHLAKEAKAGDVLHASGQKTALANGQAVYSMPSAVKAQKEFPVKSINKLADVGREDVAEMAGQRLAAVISDCQACIGGLAKNEVVLRLVGRAGKMSVTARNGGVDFSGTVGLVSGGECEFRATLESAVRAAPFMTGNIKLAKAAHGDMFMTIPAGWILFPAWDGK